jgi:FkbM family methyltransferase
MALVRRIQSQLQRVWRGVNKYSVRSASIPLLGGISKSLPVTSVGSGDGAWDIPEGVVDANWVCYSIGVGRNATFDVEMVRQFGCTMVSFDPTPSSIEYVKTLDPVPFRFVPWAIWTHDGHLDFYTQDQNNNVNCSVIDSGRGNHLCRVDCYRLKTAMERLDQKRIDLLKIDIEGGWLPVIEDFVESGITPRVFCVEFDSPTSIRRVQRAVELLKRVNLHLVHRRKDNYLFVDNSILERK